MGRKPDNVLIKEVSVDWIVEAASSDKVRHTAVCLGTAEHEVQAAVFACADYAFSLLNHKIMLGSDRQV